MTTLLLPRRALREVEERLVNRSITVLSDECCREVWAHTHMCTLVYTQLFKKLLFSYSAVSDSVTPWTAAHRAPLSLALQEELLLIAFSGLFPGHPSLFFFFLVPAYILLFIEVEFIRHNINLLKSYLFLAALGLHCCTWTFSSCGRAGATLLIVVASLVTDHGLQGEWAQYLWLMGLVAPWHMGSSQTRHQTGVPWIARWILNHWTTREDSNQSF